MNLNRLSKPTLSRPARWPGVLTPAVLVVAAALALAACGGGSSASGSSSGSSSQETAQLQATKCMRQHGVNVPAPGQGGTGGGPPQALQSIPQQTLQSAQKACQKYIQKAAGNFNPNSSAFQDAFVKFSACMRQHGINLPSPGTGGNAGPPNPGQASQLQQQPGFQQATKACQSKLPQGGPGAPGGSTG